MLISVTGLATCEYSLLTIAVLLFTGNQGFARGPCPVGQWLCDVSGRQLPSGAGCQVIQCASACVLRDVQVL